MERGREREREGERERERGREREREGERERMLSRHRMVHYPTHCQDIIAVLDLVVQTGYLPALSNVWPTVREKNVLCMYGHVTYAHKVM